jgi:hypothetical protein
VQRGLKVLLFCICYRLSETKLHLRILQKKAEEKALQEG